MRRKRLRIISLFLSMMIMLSTAIPIGSVFAAETEELPTYEELESVSSAYLQNILPQPNPGKSSNNLSDGSSIIIGDTFSLSLTQEMPSLEKYEQKWINTISFARIYFPLSSSFDTLFRITDQNGNDVTDIAGSYSFETIELSDEEYAQQLLETEKGMEESIQNSIPEELRTYNEFTELEKNADQMIDEAYAELDKEYFEGNITDEEYLEALKNLEKDIAQLKEQLNKQRAFYDSVGVTGPENIERATRFKTEYQYKLLYMLLTAYEYLPQNYSIFSFEYNTNYLKTHSGDILTFSWDITVTDRVPVGRFYFHPLLSYTTGLKTLTMMNKNPVWRGQEIRVIGSSPFKIDLQDSVNTSDPLSVYSNYKKHIPNTTVYRPITVNYLDEYKQIIKTVTINQSEYRYETKPEKIYGYDVTEIPSNASGIMPNHPLSVNYGYRLKNSSVITEYLDTGGNILYDSEIIEGKVFDQYNTEPKQIYGYELISLLDNHIGEMAEKITKVDYIYQLKGSSVTVNYLDDEGNPIAESETVNGKVFDHYETSAKEINGYRLTGTPVNAVGELTEEPITVTYFYTKKEAAVTINYLDESGNVLADRELLAGKYFTPYSTEPKKIYGYELTAIPGNASGTMQEDNTVINYIYRLKPSSVTVKHTDESGNVLSEEETVNGKVFDKYNTAARDFYGYILLHSPKNASGELSEAETTVSYIYRKIFDKLPDEPYRAEIGDLLSDMELPFGWKFADPDKIFDSAGTHTIDVIVPADETHPEIRGAVTVEVTEKPVTEPDNQPSEPIEDTSKEDLPNQPSEPIDKVPSQTDNKEDHSAQEILTINPDTGYDEILLPILLPTVSAGSVFTILLCRILKRKSPKL